MARTIPSCLELGLLIRVRACCIDCLLVKFNVDAVELIICGHVMFPHSTGHGACGHVFGEELVSIPEFEPSLGSERGS